MTLQNKIQNDRNVVLEDWVASHNTSGEVKTLPTAPVGYSEKTAHEGQKKLLVDMVCLHQSTKLTDRKWTRLRTNQRMTAAPWGSFRKNPSLFGGREGNGPEEA